MIKLVVVASGRGSNFRALAAGCSSGEISGARIVALVSNNPEALVIDIAKSKGVPVVVLDHKRFSDRPSYDRALIAEIEKYEPDFICLAGYMRLLSSTVIERWPNKIVNIHPSLLPAFPGLNAQNQALDYGVKWTGCTVHLVTEGLDDGPILAQAPLRIEVNDTCETLTDRLLALEHSTYVSVVKKLSNTKFQIRGRLVHWDSFTS
jgi:phosphoribosylglycinamide formyltransferase-1